MNVMVYQYAVRVVQIHFEMKHKVKNPQNVLKVFVCMSFQC